MKLTPYEVNLLRVSAVNSASLRVAERIIRLNNLLEGGEDGICKTDQARHRHTATRATRIRHRRVFSTACGGICDGNT